VVWNSAEPPTHVLTESYNPATLKLRIDKRPAVLWPHKEDLKLENLDLSERHLVVLTSDRKPIESFWFRFSEFNSAELCMKFDGYQGVQLADARSSRWCKCK
jgi:hypothetical protein